MDGLVYVCDRYNNRIQVFQKNGTFVKEFFVERETLGAGVTTDLVFSTDPAQRYMYVADGPNSQLHILSRDDGKVLASFARPGRYAGEFRSLHNLGVDSRGNLYTAEAGAGRRVQKFALVAD
jgi:DNA-binding beta-propeller fold protein YncE